jgi:hypothetical protein
MLNIHQRGYAHPVYRSPQGDNMIRYILATIAAAVCVASVSRSDDAKPKGAPKDSQAIEGLWLGSFGGGSRDGVVFQPVIVELFIKGDQVELSHFRNVGNLAGTLRLETSARRMHITRADKSGGEPKPKAIEYVYELKGDNLKLIDSDKFPITLQRVRVAQKPLANAEVELVAATGINDAGDLLVTELTELRAGRAGATYFQPQKRSLKTKQATVLVVQEIGCKKIRLAEARKLIRESMPVAVTYRHDDRPAPDQLHLLWKVMGPPAPDSDVVAQTFARTLRPGTLVFILSARENVAMP